MAYGINIFNSTGGVQIDGTYKNFYVSETGTYNFDTTSFGETNIDISNTTDSPIFAFKPITTCYSGFGHWDMSGTTFINAYFPIEYNYTGSIDWVVYTEAPTNPVPTYGLAVYNASSDLVFTSDERYFNIESITSLSFDYTSTQTISSVDPVNNYFFIVVSNGYNPWGESTALYWIGLKRITTTSVRAHFFSAGTATGPALSGSTFVGQLIEVSFR